jgi:hypothetical protein
MSESVKVQEDNARKAARKAWFQAKNERRKAHSSEPLHKKAIDARHRRRQLKGAFGSESVKRWNFLITGTTGVNRAEKKDDDEALPDSVTFNGLDGGEL